jgi:prepilin-type N-terminal cleavage/methylation domain-containing protein
MKTVSNITLSAGCPGIRPVLPARRMIRAGFTLVELMIALGIFVMVITGMVAVQIFGLRVQTLASTKLIATQDGRETLNAMRDQIRSSQQVYVGTFTIPTNGSIGTFSQAVGLQIGNALQLFTTTNATASSTNFIIFYQDPSTNEIICFSNANPANQWVVAQYMTNYYCFDAEDYRFFLASNNNVFLNQNVLTNYMNNPVIGVTMNFSQWEYPIGYVGGNAANAYDYYYLRTHITRRCKQ